MGSLTILLIEDTQAIATQVCDYLEQQGVIVDYAATGKQGMQLAQTHHYDVILLDIMLPDIDEIVAQDVKDQTARRMSNNNLKKLARAPPGT